MVALFVLITFVLIISINLIVTKIRDKKIAVFEESAEHAASSYAVFTKDSIYVPKDVYFNPNHTWASITGEGNLSIGVDDFINKIVQPGSIHLFAKNGDRIQKGDNLFELHKGNKKIVVKSPVTGIVNAVNHRAVNNTSSLKEDPYEENWLLQVDPQRLGDSLAAMHIGKPVVQWMKNEIERFKDFLSTLHLAASPVGATMYDGGNIVEGVFTSFDDEVAKKFESEFLS